jgi:hypothetical protein
MSKKTFGHIAKKLASNGYEPVPIIRGEKRPAPSAWQQGGWEDHTEQYEKNFTGLLTRHNPSVDIDVSDDELVQQIRAIVFDVLDCHEMPPPRRIGNAPRELLMFRTEEPFAKLSTASYRLSTDANDKGSKVEILADGQQFLAYAIHPITNKPYLWNGGGEPLSIARAQLITLDEYQAREIIARADALLALHGPVIGRQIGTGGAIGDRVSADKLEADDPIMATAALAAMPNPNVEFEDWIRALYAAKAALGESGKDAFMRWSAKSSKHDPVFSDREWKKAKPNKVGAGTLIWMAKALGWSPASVALRQSTKPSADDGAEGEPWDDLPAVDDDGVVDLVWPHISSGKNPKPLNTLENFKSLSDYLGVNYSMDVMSGAEIVSIPGLRVAESEAANSAVTYMISQANLAQLPSSMVAEYMSMLCAQNPFHPARNWIESVPWDGVSRLKQWMDTVQADNESLKELFMRRWAVGAVAALYQQQGVSAHGVLIFLGDQGIGKTSWFNKMAPEPMRKDGMMLRPDLPDSVRQVTSYWMVELGELDATFRKSDIAALKAFITSDSDVYRLPYARKNTVKPRRTVFFASVNEEKFLSDNTGNRRYWTIKCRSVDYHHSIDMQQFWAEIKTLYEAGEKWHLDGDEADVLNQHNQDFTQTEPIIESVESKLDWEAQKHRWTWKTATEICHLAGWRSTTRSEVTKVGVHLKTKRNLETKMSRGITRYFSPPEIADF